MSEDKLSTETKGGRVSKIEWLFNTNEGRDALTRMIMMIENRASYKSAAMSIGIAPKTLSKWIRLGKEQEEGLYRVLWDRVCVALGHSVAHAEIELGNNDAKFYLLHGFGKALMGDAYSPIMPDETFNLDSTISKNTTDNPYSIDNSTSEQLVTNEQLSTNEHTHRVDNSLVLEALIALRDDGQDVNQLIDSLIAQKKIEDSQRKLSGESPALKDDLEDNGSSVHVE